MKQVQSITLLFSLLLLVGFLTFNLPAVLATSSGASPTSQTAQQIVDKLLRDNNIPEEKVKSVKMDTQNVLNAYTDGQNIVMTKKLWNALKTNDERAFVLSHELGHIMANHVTKSVFRSAGFSILTRVVASATGNAWVANGTSLGLQLANMKFSRLQETQADERGIIAMKTAGYNPNAALVVFKVLKEGSGNGKGVEFLQTHPLPESRIRELVNKYGLKNDPSA